MIQDIDPKQLDIDFRPTRITSEDLVILVHEHNILMNEEGGTFTFVSYKDLQTQMDVTPENFVYLFAVDNQSFYLYLGVETLSSTKNNFVWVGKRDLFNLEEAYLGFVAYTASHLHEWYTTNVYCGRCGQAMNVSQTDRTIQCPKCSLTKYPQINPVVIVAIHDKDKLLLTKYANSSYDRYALVAGFVEIGESFEAAVKREVFEEVGLHVKNIEYYGSQPWGISGGILSGYFAQLDGDSTVKLDLEELKEGTWFTIDTMPEVNENEKSLTRTLMYEWRKRQLG